MPLGFSLFFLLINFKKPVKSKLVFVIVFLWTFSIGFIADLLWKLVEYPWQRIDENAAPTADAIVVLSSNGLNKASGKANIIEWRVPDRFFAEVTLFKREKLQDYFSQGE